MHPVRTFLQQKYDRLKTITLEGFGFMFEANDIEDVTGYLADLPAGLSATSIMALGLNYDIRADHRGRSRSWPSPNLHIVKGDKGRCLGSTATVIARLMRCSTRCAAMSAVCMTKPLVPRGSKRPPAFTTNCLPRSTPRPNP